MFRSELHTADFFYVTTGLLSIPLPLCLYCGGKDGILIKGMDRLKIK
jgi:hypothetical protein